MPMYRFCALPLLACMTVAAPTFGAESSYDGTYTGERILTQGDPSACTPLKEPVSVTIHGSELAFTHSTAKDYVVGFFPGDDGSFGEISTDIGGRVAVINGHIGAGVLDADASGSECTYHWHLVKQ